jgi:hypothetical protein
MIEIEYECKTCADPHLCPPEVDDAPYFNDLTSAIQHIFEYPNHNVVAFIEDEE